MAVPRPLFGLILHRRRFSSSSSSSAGTNLQHFVRAAIESRNYLQIPHLLLSHPTNPNPNPNPFSFLPLLPPPLAARIVDDLLQSFLPLRPRSLPHPAYASLISATLPCPNLLPLALAALQACLRSGHPPPPDARHHLALTWLYLRRSRRCSVAGILSSIRPLGYRPDLGTCNYLLSSLCAASEAEEAVSVLRGMPGAGIPPDSESYCTVIESLGGGPAEALLREMVSGRGMAPRKGTVGRVVAAMTAEGEARRAAEMVSFLEGEGCRVGFEGYEAAAEGCVKSGELVVAARVVAEMAERGFIPYMRLRLRVMEGLAGIGQWDLANNLRRRLVLKLKH